MYPYNYCGRLFPWKLILSWFSSDKHIENLLASFFNSSLIPRFFIFQHFLIPPPPTPVQILIQPKWNGWQELGTQNISSRSVNYFSFSPPFSFIFAFVWYECYPHVTIWFIQTKSGVSAVIGLCSATWWPEHKWMMQIGCDFSNRQRNEHFPPALLGNLTKYVL